MLGFFLLLLSLLLLPDFYLWWFFDRTASLARGMLIFFPTLLALAALGAISVSHYHEWLMRFTFSLIICVAVPKLLFVLIDGLGRIVGYANPQVSLAFTFVASVVTVVFVGAQIYGCMRGWQRLQVKRTTVEVERLPVAFNDYRVVQISDFHLGTYDGDTAFVARVVDSVNALQPDLVVFTGDLVNASGNELTPHLRLLARLRAHDGVYSILGNHDYCTYRRNLTPKKAARNLHKVVSAQKTAGWRLLRNEHGVVKRGGDSLFIAGVENIGKPPFPSVGDLQKALAGVPKGAHVLLLSHDPWHWQNGVVQASGEPGGGRPFVFLTLSGHTHAMQMRLGGFSPAAWMTDYWGGLYRDGHKQLYVSTGLGGTIAYRLGAWPEIDVITLKRKE